VVRLGIAEEDAMKAAAQSERAFENVSVLRAQKIEIVDARGITRARLSTEADGEVVLRLIAANGELRVKEPGVHVLAQGGSATLKLKAGERERVLEP
jgi:hypothetical protein